MIFPSLAIPIAVLYGIAVHAEARAAEIFAEFAPVVKPRVAFARHGEAEW
jgi:hypothetical protein